MSSFAQREREYAKSPRSLKCLLEMKTFFETVSRCHFVAGSGLAFSLESQINIQTKGEGEIIYAIKCQKHMRTRRHAHAHTDTHTHTHTHTLSHTQTHTHTPAHTHRLHGTWTALGTAKHELEETWGLVIWPLISTTLLLSLANSYFFFIICFAVDECSTENHNCESSRVCVNNVASFTCICPSGFAETGLGCSRGDHFIFFFYFIVHACCLAMFPLFCFLPMHFYNAKYAWQAVHFHFFLPATLDMLS